MLKMISENTNACVTIKITKKTFDENLMRIFVNTYKFANPHINKFILLLQKEVYPYEYIDDWEKFNETSLSEKDDFYTLL